MARAPARKASPAAAASSSAKARASGSATAKTSAATARLATAAITAPRVTIPKAAGPWTRVIRTCVANVARMATTSPIALWPVPARIVRSSPKRSIGRTCSTAARSRLLRRRSPAGSLLEVAKAAEVLLDLQRLVLGQAGRVVGAGLTPADPRGRPAGLVPDDRRQHLAVVFHRGGHAERGQG